MRQTMTHKQAAKVLQKIGHPQGALYTTRPGGQGRWIFKCGCGYSSTTRATEASALDAAVIHMHNVARKAVENDALNGVSTVDIASVG